jgi:cytochrome c biogenesis protein CcmG/thiol:disulfide interchange protein DsbE
MAAHNDDDLAGWVDAKLAAIAPRDDWSANETRGLAGFRSRRGEPRSRRRGWMWLAITAGAIALMLMPSPTLRAFAHACGEFVRRGLPGAHSTDMYARPHGRRLLRDGDWRNLNGEPVVLSTYRGRVVLVTYWTTTCGQCASEMAWFSEFQHRYGAQGFAVIGVSVDEGGVGSIKQFVGSRPIEYQVVLGNRHDADPDASSIPTTFILDRDGRVAARHVGYCSKRELESDIQTVLAEEADGSKRFP